MKKIEVHITIPEGYTLYGVKTIDHTAVAIFEPDIQVREIGFQLHQCEEALEYE